jgi:hypothetical protein
VDEKPVYRITGGWTAPSELIPMEKIYTGEGEIKRQGIDLARLMKPANAPLEFEIEVTDYDLGFSAVSIGYSWTYDYFPKRRKFSRKIEHNIARREARQRKKLAKKFAGSLTRHLDLAVIHGGKR